MKLSLAILVGLVVCVALLTGPTSAQELCPQASLRSDAWLQQVVAKLNSISLSDERTKYLQEAMQNDTRAISGEQVATLLPLLSFSDNMVEAMGFMSPYVVGLNVSDFMLVLNTFRFSDDRMKVLVAIRDTLLNGSAEAKQYIADECFSFSNDKAKAYQLLMETSARDCTFGYVTALSATFVIDISGSMNNVFSLHGKSYTRLSYVKEHLSAVIRDQLKPYQQFDVLVFNDGVTPVFGTPSNATTANVQRALAFISRLSAVGGTNTYSALAKAFAVSPDTVAVYLLSDGLPNPGQVPRILAELPQWNAKRAANRQIRIMSTAFLLGPASPTDKKQSAEFMEQVAALTKGVFRNMDI